MKHVMKLAIALLVTQQSFAGAVSTVKCTSVKGAAQKIQIKITSDAFTSSDYSGPAKVAIKGLKDSSLNVNTDKAVYMDLQGTGARMIQVPLKSQADGELLIVFAEASGKNATLQHISTDDEYTVLADVTCK